MLAVNIICLIAMFLIVVGITVRLMRADRAGKVMMLKNFKRGKFLIIYIVALPLFFIGVRYAGLPIDSAIVKAVEHSVQMVLLKFGIADIEALRSADALYRATTDICMFLVIVNAVMFAMSLFGQRIYNMCRLLKIKYSKCDVYVVAGDSPDNRKILSNIVKSGQQALLIAQKDAGLKEFAFINRVAFIGVKEIRDVSDAIGQQLRNIDQRRVNVIVNLENDRDNLVCVEELAKLIKNERMSKPDILKNTGLRVFAMGEPEHANTFIKYEEITNGAVHFVNRYKLQAMDFVKRYPLTQFMDDRYLDFSRGLLKNDVDVNVSIVGFGKTGQQLYLTSVANNQFLTDCDGKIVAKTVNYFIYDSRSAAQDKNLNHSVFRYDRWLEEVGDTPEGYLPLPENAANSSFCKMDINDRDFYVSLKQNMTPKVGRKIFGYVIVCFGSDLENLDLAEKLSEKLKEWGMAEYVKLFVKIRDGKLKRDIIDKNSNGRFITFGNLDELVFDSSRIIAEENEVMAKDRHICYTIESEHKMSEEETMIKATEKWYEDWNQVQRESNIYACLNLRQKLQLLGFDMSREGDDASEEFYKTYEQNDEIHYTGEVKNGKKIVDYGDCVFKEDTPRNILARQEHLRWNAYMIMSGYIPASLDEMKTLDKRALMAQRKHANITTYDGLKKFKAFIAGNTGSLEKDCDVIKYDYQILDDVKWLLERHGYKIVKRNFDDKTGNQNA